MQQLRWSKSSRMGPLPFIRCRIGVPSSPLLNEAPLQWLGLVKALHISTNAIIILVHMRAWTAYEGMDSLLRAGAYRPHLLNASDNFVAVRRGPAREWAQVCPACRMSLAVR